MCSWAVRLRPRECVSFCVSGVTYSWGSGSCGVLGNGSLQANTIPQLVQLNFTADSDGNTHRTSSVVTGASKLYVEGCEMSAQFIAEAVHTSELCERAKEKLHT